MEKGMLVLNLEKRNKYLLNRQVGVGATLAL